MIHPPNTSAQSSPRGNAVRRAVPSVERLVGSVIYHGPKQLLTSRISSKCAGFMTALCAPSLICCSLLTVPSLLFQSPEQRAYFYFSQILNGDPSRWLVVFLASVCVVVSLAVPALMPPPKLATDY
jgi:hypothetical protein